MAELKTKPTKSSVSAFLKSVTDPDRRKDASEIVKLMTEASGENPVMWGTSIVGFGQYTYRYSSGKEGDWLILGFAPRKQNLTFYLMGGLEAIGPMLKKLGKHKISGSCLHIKSLNDIDIPTLKAMMKATYSRMKQKHKT